MLVRRLAPFQANIGKRLIKSPKVYVRDSGIVHALLNIGDHERCSAIPCRRQLGRFRHREPDCGSSPADGSAVLPHRRGRGSGPAAGNPKHGLWAIEIKRGLSARPEKGFFIACDDLKPARRFVVNSGTERYRSMRIRRRSDCVNWRRRWRLCRILQEARPLPGGHRRGAHHRQGFPRRQNCYYVDDSVYHTFSGIVFDHCQYRLQAFKKGETEICTVFGQTCDGMDPSCNPRNCPGSRSTICSTRRTLAPTATPPPRTSTASSRRR